MKGTLRLVTIGVVGFLLPSSAMAESEMERVKRILSEELTPIIEHIAPSPVEGMYEVTLGGQVVYVSKDARYVFSGRLIELKTREDLTERVLSAQRLKVLASVSEARMIIFEPEGQIKHTITTFTDIDCPYCRKMHREMSQLNDLGIRVRYMLFPRAGVRSVSYEKAVSVWCAADQQAEMTLAKSGVMPEKRTCENPITQHMALAEHLQLTGTPYTITDTGRVITGYMPVGELSASLDSDKQRLAQRQN